MILLPPAYVVRREGNSFTLLVCSHPGGYPYPIMLCNISQNAMGQPGGYPYPIMLCNISQNAMGQLGGTLPGSAGGGTLARGVPWLGGYPGQVGRYPGWGGTLAGVPWSGSPPPPARRWGGYPGRTTGVFTTWRAVCLLRSRRRTFLLHQGRIFIHEIEYRTSVQYILRIPCQSRIGHCPGTN